MSSPSKQLAKNPAAYIIFALIWLAIGAVLGRRIVEASLYEALISSVVFSIPIFAAAIYSSTIRKIRGQIIVNPSGPLRPFLIRRTLSSVWWGLWSIGSAFFFLLYFAYATEIEWIMLLVALSLFFVVSIVFEHLSHQNFKPFIAVQIALSYARATTAVLVTALYLFLLLRSADYQQEISWKETLEICSSGFQCTSPSPLITHVMHFFECYVDAKQFVLTNIRSVDQLLYMVCIATGSLALFYNATLAFSGCLIPWREYQRVIGPIQDSDDPPAHSVNDLAVLFLAIGFSVGAYFYWARWIDAYLQPDPIQVEVIGDDDYQIGTMQRLEAFHEKSGRKLTELITALEGQKNLCLYRLESSIEQYIDWYNALVKMRPHEIDQSLQPTFEDGLKSELFSSLSKTSGCNFMYDNLKKLANFPSEYRSASNEMFSAARVTRNTCDTYNEVKYPIEKLDPLHVFQAPPTLMACYANLSTTTELTRIVSLKVSDRLDNGSGVIGTVIPRVANGLRASIASGEPPYPATNLKKHLVTASREVLCFETSHP